MFTLAKDRKRTLKSPARVRERLAESMRSMKVARELGPYWEYIAVGNLLEDAGVKRVQYIPSPEYVEWAKEQLK